jgi:ubiquinone/menaquinone biosynthesis C-methylase UbiE
MIELAEKRQQKEALENVTWAVGDAVPLPYADNSFSLVITRYSLITCWRRKRPWRK